MIHRHNTIAVSASPDEVWAFLGDLARAPEYVPDVVTTRLEGALRVCTDVQGNEIREEMSDYSSEERAFSFRHVQIPLPVKSSRGKFSVEANGAGSLVAMDWEIEPLDPAQESELASMIDGASKKTLENIRDRVESMRRESR